MKKSFLFTFLFLLTLSFFSSSLASAAVIVPCGGQGNPCQVCHIPILIRNILDYLAFTITPPLAALMFIIAGFVLLTAGGNPERVKRARDIFLKAVIGVLIVYTSWLVIAEILQFTLKGGTLTRPWNELPKCDAPSSSLGTGTSGVTTGGTQLAQAFNANCINTASDGIDSCSQFFKDALQNEFYDQALGDQDGSNVMTSKGTINCNAYTGALNAYAPYIQSAAAETGLPPERIEAFILVESSGRADAIRTEQDGKSSVGLMQVRPEDTAKFINPSFQNLSNAAVKQKLFDPQTNIMTGSKYLQYLSGKYGAPSMAAAAYNGGPLANKPSKDCSNVVRWQCPWDDPAHTLPNERPGHPGYSITRRYTVATAKLEQAIKAGTCKPITL